MNDDIDDDDPRDRLLEAMLPQVVDGRRAPDLRARVQAALAERQAAATRAGVRPARVRARWWGLALGAAAAAVAAWLALGHPVDVHPVEVRVAAGCIEWLGRTAAKSAIAGDAAQWELEVGDRLRVCAGAASLCDLAALGRLAMTRNTEIEVTAMQWKSFSGGAALGALTVAVVSGAIHWSSADGDARARAGEGLELTAQSGTLSAASAVELQQQLRDLQAELARVEARNRELEVQVGRSRADGAPPAEAPAPVAAAKLPPGISQSGMDELLAAIDWDLTGECMHAMTDKMDQVLAALEAGKDMPFELVGEIQKLNGELVKQVAALAAANVPGSGANGVFTNPVVAANQMYAALAKAGMPLTDAQRELLQKLSSQTAADDEARRGAQAKDDFALGDVIGETELKDRFYAEARRMMTPEQESALFPARLEGRVANLFATGLVWAQFQKPVEVADRADFGVQVSKMIGDKLGLDAASAATLQSLAANWARELPDSAFAASSAAEQGGFGRIVGMGEVARRQLAFLREVDRALPLTAKQRESLRKARTVFVPRQRGQ